MQCSFSYPRAFVRNRVVAVFFTIIKHHWNYYGCMVCDLAVFCTIIMHHWYYYGCMMYHLRLMAFWVHSGRSGQIVIIIIVIVIIVNILVFIIVKSYKISKKKRISHFSPLDLNHKTPKISPWAYILQRAFLVGLYSGVGGYNLVPRLSCLSDIGLHRRPISERQETLR